MDFIKENICNVLKRIENIPNDYRKFSITSENVQSSFGIKPKDLAELTNAGLPNKKKDDRIYYDSYDLMDCAFYFGFPSIQYITFRTWGATLRKSEKASAMDAAISYVPVENPEEKASNNKKNYQILVPDEGRIEISGYPNTIIKKIAKPLRIKWPAFPPKVKTFLDEVNQLDFFMLPEEIRWDLDFIQRTKMGDCGSASKYLYMLAKDSGIEARHWMGLVPAQSYSGVRYFTDILVDDIWVPADPHLLKILKYMNRLDELQWPFYRSPGAALIPLVQVLDYRKEYGLPVLNHFEQSPYILDPIAMSGDSEIPLSLKTEIILT